MGEVIGLLGPALMRLTQLDYDRFLVPNLHHYNNSLLATD